MIMLHVYTHGCNVTQWVGGAAHTHDVMPASWIILLVLYCTEPSLVWSYMHKV